MEPEVAAPSAAVVAIQIKASRKPSDFFNLARKLLKEHRVVELCAMDVAIIVATDTANLLVRTKHAEVIRILTDCMAKEEQRKKQHPPPRASTNKKRDSSSAMVANKARIRITLKRSDDYHSWLRENDVDYDFDENTSESSAAVAAAS